MAVSRKDIEELYCRLERPMYNFVLRWIWLPERAQELTQDCFVKLWKKRDEIDIQTMPALAYKIALNLAKNERRTIAIRQQLNPLLDLFGIEIKDPSDAFLAKENLHSLRMAIDNLPVELREVLLLTEFSQLSLAEVGTILRIPEGTVASRKNRAIKTLKTNIGDKI